MCAELLGFRDVRWISLQYGDHAGLEARIAAAGASILVDRSVDQFADMDRFAAQVAAMDLVITIDNSTAHLAGALGVPVWMLTPFAPDWRWMLRRKDSPWYPSMRLFRQPERGDWRSVVEAVCGALEELDEEGIGGAFAGDGRGGAVAGDDQCGVGQGQEAVLNAGEDLVEIAAG